MAKFEPNEEQRLFLELKNSNVLVSASAGSGKTSTMIKKLVKILLEERVSITSLLVVTYTNAAASEIKLKLLSELTTLLNESVDNEEKVFLQEQIDNIGNAEIGTLHSICKKLIVKYFYELEESPDFSLALDKEQKYFLELSIKNVFSQLITNNDEQFFELYDSYNSKRNDMILKSIVLQVYNFKISKLNYKEWIENFINKCYTEDLNNNIACIYILNYFKSCFSSLKLKCEELISSAGNIKSDKILNFLQLKYQFIDELQKIDTVEMFIKFLNNTHFPNRPSCSKNASVDDQELYSRVEEFNKDFNDYLKSLKESFGEGDVQDIQLSIVSSRKNVLKLIEVVDKVAEYYSVLKKKKNILDFNDLEDKMLKLLESDKIRETIKNQYKFVFVDEYQDINDKQETILQNIVSCNNYYMIGDVKQSIYAFRQSSPKIFVNKYNDFSSTNTLNTLINFNKNYRSSRNILDVCNKVFDILITKDTIGIDYKNSARFESLKEFDKCRVRLNILNADKEAEDKEKSEAILVANEILRLINSTKDNGEKYTYGDIAIILRKRGTFLTVLTETLINMQIPIKATIGSEFLTSPEVIMLISILKTISNQNDDVAVVTVLKNLFELTESELLDLKYQSENNMSFYNCAMSYVVNNETKNKLDKFFEFVSASKMCLARQTIREYLFDILTKFNIFDKLLTSNNGNKKVDNIKEFLKITDNENYEYDIDKFIEYLDFIMKESGVQNLGEDGNAVEICTIHHSKGLEYPAVILAGLGKNFQLNKDSSDVILSGNFGIGLKSINSKERQLRETVVRSAAKLDNIKSEINEEIRLLYVAMTRAKEELSLIGTYDLEKIFNVGTKSIYSTKNYMEMILKSFDRMDINSIYSKQDFVSNEGKSCSIEISVFEEGEFKDIEKEPHEFNISKCNDEFVNKLKFIHNYKVNLESVVIKNTVTNILREESDYENLNYSPKTLSAADKTPNKNSLKLGTTYHTIMQEINFNENQEAIERLIGRLVVENKIEKEFAQQVCVSEILQAVENLKPIIVGATQVFKEKQFLLCENYNKLVNSTDNNTKVIVQGVIDLVIIKDDKIYLIDYKTNRGMTEKDLIKQYSIQINLYTKAFEEGFGKHVDCKFLYSFALGRLIKL